MYYHNRYCFTLFDVGEYGSNNNDGLFSKSSVGQKLEAEEVNILPMYYLNNCLFDTLPLLSSGR